MERIVTFMTCHEVAEARRVSLGFKGCPKWACIDFMWQAYEGFFLKKICPNGKKIAPTFDKPHQEGS